jgi:hypothetical protein
MKRLALAYLILCWAIIILPTLLVSEDQQPTSNSLGELARHFREQRSKAGASPARVITNDDFPRLGEKNLTAQSPLPKSRAEEAAAKDMTPRLPSDRADNANGEEFFRTKSHSLRAKLQSDQEALRKVEQRIARKGEWIDETGETHFYGVASGVNPEDSASADWTDIDTLRAMLYRLRKSIQDDQNALLDLEDQCRRQGCMPSWLR